MPFTDVKECMDFMETLLQGEADDLGLKYVGYGDERLLPGYPAVVIQGEDTNRTLHATQKFLLTFRVSLWVYHAKLTVQHRVRTAEDMALAFAIRDLLHEDKKFGMQLIFSYVEAEIPGVIRRGKNDAIVGTRLAWMGTSLVGFQEE